MKNIAIGLFVLLQMVLISTLILSFGWNDSFGRNSVISQFVLAEIFFCGLFMILLMRYFFPNQDDERTLKIRSRFYEIQNLLQFLLIIAFWLSRNSLIMVAMVILPVLSEICMRIVIKYLPDIEQ